MKVLVILGNRLKDDGSMSETMLARLDKGVETVKQGGIDKVIVSGGMPNAKAGRTEAECMKEYLIKSGVSPELIIEENKSNTTKGNAKLCVPIIEGLKADTVVLCTSEYHVNRFFNNARKLFWKRLKKIEGITLELALAKNVG